MPDIDPSLLRNVDLLSLDAGNTVIFFDHERFALACRRIGLTESPETFIRAEGVMKVALESGEALDLQWSKPGLPGSLSWGIAIGTILDDAGLPRHDVTRFLDVLWEEHRQRNFWSKVPEGLAASLRAVRARGLRVVIVSNSEGELERVLAESDLLDSVDGTIDSGLFGIEKPDPRIFQAALDRFGTAAARALHLGDTYATDIVGAHAAGLRAALIDPYGHYAGRHTDVPRVPSARAVAEALASSPRAEAKER